MHDYNEVKAILFNSYLKLLLVISNLLVLLIKRLFKGLAHRTGTSSLVSCRFYPLAVFNFGIRTVLKNISSMAHFLNCLVHVSADMFESVNKKTVVHPLFKVGFSISKRLPEEARLNSDG